MKHIGIAVTFVKQKQQIFALGLLLLIILLGSFLRIYKFGEVPAGLNQDEASAAYETISLITGGSDRWGNHYPVYFLSWGSGQNVLLSYLNMPVFLMAGVNLVTIRFWPMILGILTIPLIYLLVKELSTSKHRTNLAAFIAASIVAVTPVFVMQSRWALEANIMPFFLLLGSFLYIKALKRPDNWLFFWAMLALALACYGYILALPILLTIVFIAPVLQFIKHRKISRKLLVWLIFFGLLIMPLLLVIIKNYIVKAELPFENLLPFSLPMFTIDRLSESTVNSLRATLAADWNLFRKGLDDGTGYNALAGYDAILPVFLLWPLSFLGIFSISRSELKKNWGRIIILIWLLTGVFFLGALSLKTYIATNRLNGLLIPLVILVSLGMAEVINLIVKKLQHLGQTWTILLICFAGLLMVGLEASNLLSAYAFYFSSFDSKNTGAFYPGLTEGIVNIKTKAGEKPIYIDEKINLNYLFVLLAERIAPQTFRNQAKISNQVKVASINNFYFYTTDLPKSSQTVYYLTLKGTPKFCRSQISETLENTYYLGSCSLK